VVDFLSAKVPDVEFDGFSVDCNGPVCDVESVGLGLVGVVFVVDEAVDQGGFADAALPDEEDFGFVEGADFAAAEFAEVVEDGGGSAGFIFAAEDFWRNGQGIAAEVEFFKFWQCF
jgi:hypothetical protein